MQRLLVSALVAFAATASILSLTYPIPLHSTATYVSSSILTAINPEILVDYSTSTLTCAGSPQTCYEQIIGYTTTTTWSGETTQMQTLASTSTTLVPIAFSGSWGNVSAILSILLLFISGALLAKNMIFRHTARMN
jgi:hypothetical protein